MNRRAFLQDAAVTIGAAAWPAAALAQGVPWKVGGFTKTIQDLSFEETARVTVDAGWDGIELALRAADTFFRSASRTSCRNWSARSARAVAKCSCSLRTSAEARNRSPSGYCRRRHARAYGCIDSASSLSRRRVDCPTGQGVSPASPDLAALNRQLGVTGLLQNHSGSGYVGFRRLGHSCAYRGSRPRDLGVHFDIGHATVESGLSWPTTFALVKDRVGAVIVKDFFWKFTPGGVERRSGVRSAGAR